MEKKIFKAFVCDRETKETKFIEMEYSSRKHFISDLRCNGYSVKNCMVKEVYDFLLENTNCTKYDKMVAKRMYRNNIPLTKEKFNSCFSQYI